MSKNAPALPLFGDAYLADTRHLSLEEHGAYLQLLLIAWRTDGCRLPDDDARIARMLGVTAGRWSKLKPTVMAFWERRDGYWFQGRLTKERNFVEQKRAINSSAAKARWQGQAIENKETDASERICERNAPPPPPNKEVRVSDATHHSCISTERLPVDEALSVWNEQAVSAGWPQVRKLSTARSAAIKARLREDGMEGWTAALVRARSSPFIGQSPPPGWFTFDWVTKQGNFLKLTEGNYDGRQTSRGGPAGRSVSGTRPSSTLAILRAATAAQREDPGDREQAGFDLPAPRRGG